MSSYDDISSTHTHSQHRVRRARLRSPASEHVSNTNTCGVSGEREIDGVEERGRRCFGASLRT